MIYNSVQNSREQISVKVIDLKKESDELYVLSLDFYPKFIPGQVISLTVSENIPPRLYSIASGDKDKYLKILFNIKESGILTPKLAELKNNDTVFVSIPFGEFTSTNKDEVWIASGTGIAPFISMVQSGNIKNKILLHGARYKSSFYQQNELTDTFKDNYIRCCSKEKGEGLYYGRLTKYLEEVNNLPLDAKFYLCGRTEMIVEVRDILINKGVAFNRIIAEIYF